MRTVLLAGAIWAGLAGLALAQGGNPLDRMMAADANGDGAISKAEARAGREAQFRRVDTNGDGFVTADERAAVGRGQGKAKGGGIAGDSNGDGKVSLAEFLNTPYRGFDIFDSNRNDILEASEIQAARDRLAQRKNGTP